MAAVDETRLNRIAAANPAAHGDFYTPREMAQCMAELLEVENGAVYDPCCSSGALLLGVGHNREGHGLRLYGQTQDQKSYALCQMNSLLYAQSVDLGGGPADTLQTDRHEGEAFDYIVSNPPFNRKDWFADDAVFWDRRWRYGIPPRSNANFA